MSDSTEDEIEQIPILEAIAALSKKLDDHKKEIDARFDSFEARFDALDLRLKAAAVQFGIVHYASHFDRIDAGVYNMRSDILNLKADLRYFTERVRRNKTEKAGSQDLVLK